MTFNSYSGLRLLFPGSLARVVQSGRGLHEKLVAGIYAAMAGGEGEETAAALEMMELTCSVV